MPAARTHGRNVALNQAAVNATIALLLALLFLIFFFLYAAVTAQPAHAQTSVPPTARQAATMPQFASRLRPGPAQNASRAYHLQAPYRNPLRSPRSGALPTDDIVYTNGPINGTTDAWTINFGFIVSNTFTVPSGGANLTSLNFGAWLAPGDVLQTVEVSITSDPLNGGTSYFDGIVNFTQDGCIGNQYGFNVCTESGALTVNNLAQGTYWLNLQNATVNTGDPVYWDENSGPSLASQNSVGTIPSEAFTLLGSTTTTCFPFCEPPPDCVHDGGINGASFQLIHDFSAEEQSPNPGLAISQAGKLFGSTPGGNHGAGLAYELAPNGADWIFTPLYHFLGGSFGQGPSPEVIGLDGALYGTADGGLQQCGNSGDQYCGFVYRLRPSPSICFAALCSWNESVIYRFTGIPDGFGPNGHIVFDHAGNLYGTTFWGGAFDYGSVFELTPSHGGWTEKVVYSFRGGVEGQNPDALLVGEDGNLYGTTHSYYSGGPPALIFQLTPSGSSWTKRTLATFGGCGEFEGSCNPVLSQEHSGKLYGLYEYTTQVCFPACYYPRFGRLFEMLRVGDGWQFSTLDDTYGSLQGSFNGDYDVFRGVVVDADGTVYASEGLGEASIGGEYEWGRIMKLPVYHNEVCSGPDNDNVLVCFGRDNFYQRDLEVSAGGKLYGTTYACGDSQGTVWQLTPP